MLNFLKWETTKGNYVYFPQKEFGSIIVLDKSGEKQKFLIFDVFKNDIIWWLPKQGIDDIFACDSEARVLVYSWGQTLQMHSLNVHPTIA